MSQQSSSPPSLQTRQNSIWWSSSSSGSPPTSSRISSPSELSSLASHWMPSFSCSKGPKSQIITTPPPTHPSLNNARFFEGFPKPTPAISPFLLPSRPPKKLYHPAPPLKGPKGPQWPGTHTVWAAPLALRSLLHIWIQADHVVSSGTGITQDDLATLLAHLAIVLVVCLITIHSSHLLLAWARKRESPVIRKKLPPPPRKKTSPPICLGRFFPSHSHPNQSHINTKKKHTFLFLFSGSEFLAAAATTAGGTIGNRIAIDTGIIKVRFHI